VQRSTKLNNDEVDRLRAILDASAIKLSSPTNEFEILRVMDRDISFIVYKSGKMVYEDNPGTMKIVDQILTSKEQNARFAYELGSDEAGKGEWYGPLVVVCVSIKPSDINELRRLGVKDSKTLSQRGIKIIANEIKKSGRVVWKRTLLTPPEYNSMISRLKAEGKNLNDLLAWAHSVTIREVIKELVSEAVSSSSPIRVTIDLFDEDKMSLSLQGLEKGVTIVQKVGGEEDIPVAAASILAKSLFEEEVDKLCQNHRIDLRIAKPAEVPKDIIGLVGKVHFKNVSKIRG